MAINPAKWAGIDLCNGRYCSLEKLGEGGMGFVYRARDKRMMNKFVVIKVPRAEMVVDSQFRKRFVRELQSLVALDHRHIVAIQDYNQEDKIPYAVMQYLPGGDLEGRMSREPGDLTKWLLDIASALDFVHSKGFVHRDVKPGNILFDEQDYAYLSDFGIAKVVAESEDNQQGITSMGFAVGTPQYMAPELAKRDFDGRIDQYALAVTVYEVLSGDYPFEGDTNQETIMLHHTEEMPFIKTISDDLNRVIQKGMAKKPENRYPNCTVFANEVLRVVNSYQPLVCQEISEHNVAARVSQSTEKESAEQMQKRPMTMVEPVGNFSGEADQTNSNSSGQSIDFDSPSNEGPDKSVGGGDTQEVKNAASDTKKKLVKSPDTSNRNTSDSARPFPLRAVVIGGVVTTVLLILLAMVLMRGGNVEEARLIGKWRWDYGSMLKQASSDLQSQIRNWQDGGVKNIIEFRQDGVVIERLENAAVPSESRSEFKVKKIDGNKIDIEVASPLSDVSDIWTVDLNKYNTRGTVHKKGAGMRSVIYLRKESK